MQTKTAMATNHRSRACHAKGEISDTVMESIKHDPKTRSKPYYTKQQSPLISLVGSVVGY
jgi:hypothetical protein